MSDFRTELKELLAKYGVPRVEDLITFTWDVDSLRDGGLVDGKPTEEIIDVWLYARDEKGEYITQTSELWGETYTYNKEINYVLEDEQFVLEKK